MSRIAPPAAGAILVSSPAQLRPRRLTLTRWSGHRTAAILVTWWVFLGGLHAAWLARDTRPPHWDAAVHLLSSLRYRQALAGFFSGSAGLAARIERLFSVDAYYPPFAPFVGSLLTLGFRPSAASSTWALNQFFLALLILGTFRLGSRVGGPVSGLAAAVAVTTFGGICSASHAFMLDLPLAAMTVLSLDALAGTHGFARTGRSLVFGLICGVGMLTKWTFLFFLLAPTVAELAALRRFADPGRRLRNSAAALLVSAAVALPWYLVHAPNLAQEIVHFGGFSRADGTHFPAVWSVQSLAFYPRSVAELLLLPWVAALAVGLALCWRRSPALRRLALLSIAALMLLTLLPAKDARYALPLLPAAAVVATAWAGEGAPRGRFRLAAVGGLALVSLVLSSLKDSPVPAHWKIEEALAAIPEVSRGKPACVRVVPDLPEFHRFAFEYAAGAAGRNVEIAGGDRLPWFTDAVIVKTGNQGRRPGPGETMASIRRDESFRHIFGKIWEGELPDGSRAEVYARAVQPIVGVAPADLVEKLKSAIRREVERNVHAEFAGQIDVEPDSEEETRRGRFRRVRISAENLRVGGKSPGDPLLLVREMVCELFGVAVNPQLLPREELQLLSLDEVAPRIVLREEDVNAWLAGRSLRVPTRVRFLDGEIRASFGGKNSPLARLVAAPRIVAGGNLGIEFRSLRISELRLPVLALSLMASQYNPVLKEMPCRFRIGTVRCERGIFEIGN